MYQKVTNLPPSHNKPLIQEVEELRAYQKRAKYMLFKLHQEIEQLKAELAKKGK